jgi:glutamate 5-kinase
MAAERPKPAERLVIKVGTNVLTRSNQQLDYNTVHQIVEQIGALRKTGHKVLLVTSGAAGAGRALCEFRQERNSLVRRQMMTAVGQPRLMQLYTDFFREFNIVVAQGLLTRSDFADRAHYLSVRNVIEGLLMGEVLPIVNENDVVASEELTFGDNDYLAAAVAAMIGAHRLFLLTTADGFYMGGEPGRNPEAKVIREAPAITPEMWASCESSLQEGGRGGMLSKLKAVEMATSFGIEAYIASGKEPRVVPRILAGEALGSRFLARTHRLKGYRQWLRFGAMANGRVIVDEGAAKALLNNKSLLPAGIAKVEGSFTDGDVVEIYSRDMEKLGVGLINFSSADMEAMIRGEKPRDRSQEAIHKDRLLLVVPGPREGAPAPSAAKPA